MNLEQNRANALRVDRANDAVPQGAARSRVPWQVVAFALACGFACVAILVRPALHKKSLDRIDATFAGARAALEAGDFVRAEQLALRAASEARRAGRAAGPGLFVLGQAREHRADSLSPTERISLLAAAANDLANALSAGVDESDKPALRVHLGRCLLDSGNISECIPVLDRAAQDAGSLRAEALALLTRAYADPARHDLDRAIAANARVFQLPDLSIDQLLAAWQVRAALVAKLGASDSFAGLAAPRSTNDAGWVAALVEAQQLRSAKRPADALAGYRELLTGGPLPDAVACRTRYLLGITARECGDAAAALAAFREVGIKHPDSDEAYAATVHAGALMIKFGNVEHTVKLLAYAADRAAAGYASALLDTPSLVRLLESAIRKLAIEGHFEAAEEIVASYQKIAGAFDADRLAALVHESWAEATLHDAESLAPSDAADARYRAAELFRTAGTIAARAAEQADSPRDCVALWWQAARNLLDGESFLAAFNAADRLLAEDDRGELRPKALALACAALEGANMADRVHEYARECVRAFPNHPAAATARLHWARAQAARGDDDDAAIANLEAVLRGNVHDVDVQVAEQARLLLAKLLMRQGRGDEAVPELKHLVATAAPRDVTLEAHYLLAECLREHSRLPAGRVATTQNDSARSHFRKQKDEELDQALDHFDIVQVELAALETDRQITPIQQALLRQCRWGIADTLYDLERFEPARSVYELLAKTYDEPADWLASQIQIANCHSRLNQSITADAVLRAARDRFERMPIDEVRQARAGMSEERWREWTNWIKRL